MKRQDLVKFHHQDIAEIKVEISRLEASLVENRQQIKLGQQKNVHLTKSIRQDIARLKTIIRHKELTGKSAIEKKPKSTKITTSKPKAVKKTSKTKTKTKKES